MDINLNGMIYTSKLGIHYLRKNQEGGSVVITASVSSKLSLKQSKVFETDRCHANLYSCAPGFVPFALTDYGKPPSHQKARIRSH